jgi:hypothetical protein
MTPTERAALNARLAEKLGWTEIAPLNPQWPGSPVYGKPPAHELPPKGMRYRVRDYLTGNGMLEVLERMRERDDLAWSRFVGRLVTLCLPPDSSVIELHWLDFVLMEMTPELVAEAALAALEGE